METVRTEVRFESAGETCAAWLFRPVGRARPPVVVLGHGFAATRAMGLEAPGRAFAPPGGFAVLPSPSSYEGDPAIASGAGSWRNAVAARSILEVARYRPAALAARIRCPLLLLAARDDDLIPLRAVEEVARRWWRARLQGRCFENTRTPASPKASTE